MGIEQAFEARNLVTQREAPLFQAAQQKLVARNRIRQAIDRGIEVGVLDPQLDELTRKGMKIGVQRAQFTNGTGSGVFSCQCSLDNTSSFRCNKNP